MITPEPCTTQARRKLHWSTKLESPKSGRLRPGRRGRTLCGNYGQDQEYVNYQLAQWSTKRITVIDLPECKQCAKAKAAGEAA